MCFLITIQLRHDIDKKNIHHVLPLDEVSLSRDYATGNLRSLIVYRQPILGRERNSVAFYSRKKYKKNKGKTYVKKLRISLSEMLRGHSAFFARMSLLL